MSTTSTTPEFQDEYEGPTAAEAAEAFVDAAAEAKAGFDVRSLDPRKLDLSTLRDFDWRSLDPRELVGKVDLSKVELPKVELPKVDFAKVSEEATSLVSTATTKATETASELRRSVESGVKIVRELVGR